MEMEQQNVSETPDVEQQVNVNTEQKQPVTGAINDFKVQLAMELSDKPDVLNKILEFQDTQAMNVKTLEQTYQKTQAELEQAKQIINQQNMQLEHAKQFNATLMAKIPFDSFAQPKQEVQVDPLQNFLSNLDKGGMEKRNNWMPKR